MRTETIALLAFVLAAFNLGYEVGRWMGSR
jgi:hypothetical protein